MTNLSFWVNGKEQRVDIDAGEMLADVLRKTSWAYGYQDQLQ